MILAKAKIGDFDQFWTMFNTRGAEKRREHGSRGARPFRNTGDPNEIVILFDWDEGEYQGFINDPEVPEIFQAAGLQGPPEHIELEPLEETAS